MADKCCTYPANRRHADDMIRDLLIRENDIAGVNFMKYKSVALDVYRDLNLYVIKDTRRYLIEVDKKTNSIIMPPGFLFRSSVSIIDECNQIQQIAPNPSIMTDIVDISQDKDCHCECGCQSELCGQIVRYEPILKETVEEMPDGSTKTFTSSSIKRVNRDGSFVIERTGPVRKYGPDGVWLTVELETEVEELCKLEVKDCGCVVHSEKNQCAVDSCCNATTFQTECGCGACTPMPAVAYNFNEFGDRIVFPSNFPYDNALVRGYFEPNAKDLMIPLIAKEAFLKGMKAFTAQYDDRMPLWRMQKFEGDYDKKKSKLFTLLNRMSIGEVNKVLNPFRCFQ